MKEYARMKLWEASFYKPLFRKELEKLIGNTSRHDLFDVLVYCYYKYSDMYADVLLDVFLNYRKNSSAKLLVTVESDKPITF